MLFQLCKQSLFFWLIGIEIEMETRLARGGNKVIKEIIDLRLLPLLQMLAVIVLPPPQYTSRLCGYLMKVQSLWR